MTEPKPSCNLLEYDGYLLKHKGCLKKPPSFSYRCQYYHILNCPYLLTVPITPRNYDQTWACIRTEGAKQASSCGHSQECKRKTQEAGLQQPDSSDNNTNEEEMVEETRTRVVQPKPKSYEWRSDIETLREFIRSNIRLGPKSIQAAMQLKKQKFSIKVIKENKREIFNEMFPKDRRVAFHPANCLVHESEDNYQDNMLKRRSQILATSKNTPLLKS